MNTPLVKTCCSGPFYFVCFPGFLFRQNRRNCCCRDVYPHPDQTKHFPNRTQILYRTPRGKYPSYDSVLCHYLVTYGHVCLTGIMCMAKVSALKSSLQVKACSVE